MGRVKRKSDELSKVLEEGMKVPRRGKDMEGLASDVRWRGENVSLVGAEIGEMVAPVKRGPLVLLAATFRVGRYFVKWHWSTAEESVGCLCEKLHLLKG
jgi:hypothetical protein